MKYLLLNSFMANFGFSFKFTENVRQSYINGSITLTQLILMFYGHTFYPDTIHFQ